MDLPINAVHVDLVRTADPGVLEKLEEYRPLLSRDEHDRMQRLIFERDRMAFLMTRALARRMLSRYAPVAPADWQFITNAHGRPEISVRPAGTPDLRFNISHTTGLIACAVTIASSRSATSLSWARLWDSAPCAAAMMAWISWGAVMVSGRPRSW